MTIQQFFDKYNGKGIDFDGYYGFQCMDLAHQYAVEVVGKDFAPAPAAKDVWKQNISGYDKIPNTPNGVPQKGDIVIWGVGIGPYGHIAVFDHGDQNSFVSFDQNWPLGSLCHFQNHNYNGVLGWFHPKSITTQPVINDQTIIDLGKFGKLEVQQIKGKMGDLEIAQKEVEGQLAQNKDLARQLNEEFEKVRQLILSNETLTKKVRELESVPTTSPSAPKSSLGKLGLYLIQTFG